MSNTDKTYLDSSGNPVTQSVVGVTDSMGNPVTGTEILTKQCLLNCQKKKFPGLILFLFL